MSRIRTTVTNERVYTLLSQARLLADQGSRTKHAETLIRQGMATLPGSGTSASTDSAVRFSRAEAALLLGRVYRSLSRLRLAHTWLHSAYSQFSSLLDSHGSLARIRLSECSNHLTLWAINAIQEVPQRGIERARRYLLRQQQIYHSGFLPPEVRLEHFLELVQREGDLTRIAVGDRNALEHIRREKYLLRAADMWDHNHSHRLMYQSLLEMRTGELDLAADRLETARILPITFHEPSLRALWYEKMAKLTELAGYDDEARMWQDKACVIRALEQRSSHRER